VAPAALCIPLLMKCGTPSPSPSPTPTPTPTSGSGSGGLLGGLLGGTGGLVGDDAADGGIPPVPLVAKPDNGAPTFTLPAAQLGGSSISFTGLKSVSAVIVRLANGQKMTVLKLRADDIAIDDFLLDVRKATGPSLVTTSTRMELHGNVQVYVDSATATLLNGKGITIGAATPPPGNELPSTLLRVNLGLVGVTADSIVFTAPHQDLKD
jgi:hypothetical protein